MCKAFQLPRSSICAGIVNKREPDQVGAGVAAHDARPVRVGIQAGVLRLAAYGCWVEQDLRKTYIHILSPRHHAGAPMPAHCPCCCKVPRKLCMVGPARGGGKEEKHLCAHERHAPGGLWEPLVPADSDPDCAELRFEGLEPRVTRVEVELFLVPAQSARQYVLSSCMPGGNCSLPRQAYSKQFRSCSEVCACNVTCSTTRGGYNTFSSDTCMHDQCRAAAKCPQS